MESEKLMVMGIAAVICAVAAALGMLFGLLPHKERYIRLWLMLVVPFLIVGILFIVLAQK